MTLSEQRTLLICKNIEFGLKQEYARRPELTDSVCARALDNAKVACKRQFGFGSNESLTITDDIQGIVEFCVAISLKQVRQLESVTLKEYISCLEKVRRSVLLHSKDGKRAYYEFIRRFFP